MTGAVRYHPEGREVLARLRRHRILPTLCRTVRREESRMVRIAFCIGVLGLLAACSPSFGSGQPREVVYVPAGSPPPR